MRIVDQNNNTLRQEDIDFLKGKLVDDKILLKHHDAVKASPEEGHYETVKTYDNGGKDVVWKVDKPAVKGHEAYDEFEDVQRYVPFADSELKANVENSSEQIKQNAVNSAIQLFILMLVKQFSSNMSDEDLQKISAIIPEWQENHDYEPDDVVRYNKVLYKCQRIHTSSDSSRPDRDGMNWESLEKTDMYGVLPYSQPLGAHDAYRTGARVSWNGKYYESAIDYNVWNPDVYPAGWKEFKVSTGTDDPEIDPDPSGSDEQDKTNDPDKPSSDEWPTFVQPTGAHNAYKIGDKVTYNGKHYICKINSCTWSPDAYPAGWTLQN